MSKKLLDNLQELAESIQRNAPEVHEKIASDSGTPPDEAVVISASKYHAALERLARE